MTQHEIDNLIARFKESLDRSFAELLDTEDDTIEIQPEDLKNT